MPRSTAQHLLERLERYYDAAPRTSARTEAVGPFTLFVSTSGFPFYARPRLGSTISMTPEDVARVLSRQRQLGIPEAIEWVVETTPTLSSAARSAGMTAEELPLLVLDKVMPVRLSSEVRIRRVEANEPDIERVLAVASLAFANPGTAIGMAGPPERDAHATASTEDRSRLRDRLAGGTTVLMVAEDPDGPIASGSHQPVGGVTEVVGVATLPRSRRQGIASALTSSLVQDALASGQDLIFLSAADDDVARIYERLGFQRVAHAGIAERGSAMGT